MPTKQSKDDKRSKPKKGAGPSAAPRQSAAVPDQPKFLAMNMAPALEPRLGHTSPPATKSSLFVTLPKDEQANPGAGVDLPEQGKDRLWPKEDWDDWRDAQLTLLGLYYPLGPCQRRLPQKRLRETLAALRNVFRAQSLFAEYRKSPISATCKSLDQVELEVVLFAARDKPEEMVLEISRRDGDCCSFHLYAEQIMRAVTEASSKPRPVISSSWNMSALRQADSVGHNSETIAEALEIAWGLLNTDRYDARRLGLESLMHMTDPNKCGWTTAKAVAEAFMNPTGTIQERLSKSVLEYASREAPYAGLNPPVDAAEEESPFGQEADYEADFAYLGLIIISQTLQVAEGAKTMDVKTFLEVQSDLVESIVQKAYEAEKNPHRAYYALQCLAALCHCVPSEKHRIKEANVEVAQRVGESRHWALEKAAQKLLVSLQA